ncbi:MAG: hypothetical protein IPI97_14670 [Nitrosomonas sp.]|nr:hypothetical protein [Nitrosomonas sp.]
MSKHTPGPWSVKVDTHDAKVFSNTKPFVAGIYAADGHTVLVETDDGNYPPKLADALLMAAAPEMLEALKFVLKDNNADSTMLGPSAWEIVSKAIAKAEGRE